MRDLFVTAAVLGSLPLILRRPWIGILMWCWLSYMNPHKLAWGFAYTMPFALLVAVTTLLGILISKEPKRLPLTRETAALGALTCWMVITTLFAIHEHAWGQLDKVAKILLMTFVTLIVISNEARLKAMVWAIVLSIGFFGVKGGAFTIVTGGTHRVYGPATSFIAGNNEVALALIMVIPLMRYLQLNTNQFWVRAGLGIAMFLSAVAAVGSQSRGALIAIVAMATFFWLKSRGKLTATILVGFALAFIAPFMPHTWYERMETIAQYEQDASALGRINAWWFAFNLAKARPLVGGGFETFQPELFSIYAPEPGRVHDVHSIYFEMLGEHGFVGLALFLMLAFFTWRTASHMGRVAQGRSELRSISDLTRMSQASLIAYWTGGAFLGLAYFDLAYHLIAIVIIAKVIVLRAEQTTARTRLIAGRDRPREVCDNAPASRMINIPGLR